MPFEEIEEQPMLKKNASELNLQLKKNWRNSYSTIKESSLESSSAKLHEKNRSHSSDERLKIKNSKGQDWQTEKSEDGSSNCYPEVKTSMLESNSPIKPVIIEAKEVGKKPTPSLSS